MKTFKKLISLFLAVIMLLSLVGCRQQAAGSGETGESVSLDNSGGTSDPSEPVDSSDPSEPVDPSVPSEPVDPSTPSEPDEGGDQTGDDTDKDKEEEKEDEDDEILTAPTSLDGLEIVKEAVKYLGTPYVYGGNSLTNGIDCSGFTQQIYKKFGITLPRTSTAQSKVSGTRVSVKEALPGDLYAAPGHAGIYIGDGNMIHADGSVVTCTGLDYGWDFVLIRLFDNTCSVSGEEAMKTLEKIAIANGHYGQCEGGDYYPETGKFILSGFNPLMTTGNISDYALTLTVDINNTPSGYEDLVAVWKEQFKEQNRRVEILTADPEGGMEYWSYYNGQWYSWAALSDAFPTSADLDWTTREGTRYFIPDFGNADGTWKTNNGDVVDLSTFPILSNAA